jgi:hypothetical protein
VQQVRSVAQERPPKERSPVAEAAPTDGEESPKRVGRFAYVDVQGKPKGRRRRVVMMSPALYTALKDRVRTGYVVAAEGGQRVTKEMVRAAVARIAKRAGLAGRVSGWNVC